MPTSSKPFPCVGIRTCSDYSPFGVELDGRTVSGGYRYGFNGKEKTDEISGPCNSYDFGARMHDPRIGRFLVLDPKTAVYPMFSPYCFANNSPVLFVDANGEGPIVSWLIKQMTYNKKENSAFLSYQINVHRTVYIVNSSKMNLNAEAKSAICSNISKGYTAASFSYNLTQSEIAGIDQFIDRQYSHIPNNANLTINVQMQFSATVQFVNSLDEITDGNAGGDAIQVLADEISPRAVNLNGFSLPGKNTTVHEFLHLDGATDLYKYKKGVLVKSDASIMGGNNGLLTPNMQTKSEIATFYFRSTRMAIDLEQKNIYLGQKEAGITDLEGKQNFRLDTTKETNKQELKHLRNK